MKVHEYQAKEILRRYGVPTPRGIVVDSPDEARQAAKELGGSAACFFRIVDHHTARRRNAIAPQDLFGLIFVDFHSGGRFITGGSLRVVES